VLLYIVIPALLLAASNYFAVDVTIEDEDGQSQTYKEPSAKLLLVLIGYVILIICLGFGVSSRHFSILKKCGLYLSYLITLSSVYVCRSNKALVEKSLQNYTKNGVGSGERK
jgi:hypothetical protein